MNIKINKPSTLLMTSILCTTLTACGGGGGDTITIPAGFTVDRSNYESVFKSAVTGTTKLASELMFAGVETSRLVLLGSTASEFTYACDNEQGRLNLTKIDDDTNEWVFDDCHIEEFTPGTRHDGIATVKTMMNSGDASVLGSYNDDWSATQTIFYDDYTLTSPITGGASNTSNGTVTLGSSNDATKGLYRSIMSSLDLSFDAIDTSGTATSYDFSKIYYDVLEVDSDDSLHVDIEYVANISGLGEIALDTGSALKFDDAGALVSGEGIIQAEGSSAKMVATGNDGIDISFDPGNTGAFFSGVSTTWSAIGGN